MASKSLHWVIAVAGIAAVGGAAWWWQQRDAGPSQPTATMRAGAPSPGGRPGGPGAGGPPTVEVGAARAMTLADDAQAVGELRSRQGVMLRPEVSGRIARIGFEDGQRVRRGQLLVQLDDTLQAAQLQQAEAQAAIARTNLQRSRELLAQGFVSPATVDQNAASLQVAEAQVALARAQVTRMKLFAPFDATAGIRLVDVGDYVKDGADIVNLEDLGSMAVDFRLPERYLDRLRSGQPVEVSIDALPGRSFAGRVDAVDSQVSSEGRALLVRARVENPGALLKPGMFARARVVFAVRENAVVVPEEALVPQGGRQYLWRVADGAGGQKVAQRVEARIGLRLPGQVEIMGGVAAGDVVVTAGQARLRGESVPVRVIDLARPGGAPGAPGKPASAAAGGNAADAGTGTSMRPRG